MGVSSLFEREVKSDEINPEHHEFTRKTHFFPQKKLENPEERLLEGGEGEGHGMLEAASKMGTEQHLELGLLFDRPRAVEKSG
ncbi:MAG: hypothetical protein EBX52_08625 [Proteobacteria bacterium]|nr:hypothetical protein [Pseudomonadota bacterium]